MAQSSVRLPDGSSKLHNKYNLRSNVTSLVRAVPVDSAGVTTGDRLRFTWLALAPASTVHTFVAMVAASGSRPGSDLFGLALAQTDTRTLGPGSAITTQLPAYSTAFGGTYAQFKVAIPRDPRLYVDHVVYARNPLHSQIRKGADRVYVYRNSNGESGYYLLGQAQIAEWTGTDWDFVNGTDLSFVDVTPPAADEDFAHPMPDAATLAMPAGLAMATANGRLFVGQDARLWWSEQERPTQFRKAVRFTAVNTPDVASAGSVALDGEVVQVVIPMGAATTAEDPTTATAVILLSDRNVYALSGTDPTSLSRAIPIGPHGTLAPLSAARSQTGLYWLDQRGQVCHMDRKGIKALSVGLVDDLTGNVEGTRVQWASGAVAYDRYFLSLTPSGEEANTQTLVWSEQHQAWESIDKAAAPAEHLLEQGSRLIRFGVADTAVHAEPSSVELVSVRLNLRAILRPDLKTVEFGAMQVWSDGGTYDLTTRRLRLVDGTYEDGLIHVADTDSRLRSEAGPAGIAAMVVQPQIFGDLPGGTNLNAIIAMLGHTTSSAAA